MSSSVSSDPLMPPDRPPSRCESRSEAVVHQAAQSTIRRRFVNDLLLSNNSEYALSSRERWVVISLVSQEGIAKRAPEI